MQHRCFIKAGQLGHILHFVEFGRIHLLEVIFATSCRLLVSTIWTSTSSALSFLIPVVTKPCDLWGTHTNHFWVHSARVAGSLNIYLSTERHFISGSDRSTFVPLSAMLKNTEACWVALFLVRTSLTVYTPNKLNPFHNLRRSADTLKDKEL